MGEVEPARLRRLSARLDEINDELTAIRAELGDTEAQTPDQRRRALRVIDGGNAAASG